MLPKFLIVVLLLVTSPYVLSSDLVTVNINDTSFTFSKIMAGNFDMGDRQGQDDELPVHSVSINSFYMQISVVTIEQYARLRHPSDENNNNGCEYFDSGWKYSKRLNWQNPGYKQNKQHPVVCVSWIDVQDYINRLNSLSKH